MHMKKHLSTYELKIIYYHPTFEYLYDNKANKFCLPENKMLVWLNDFSKSNNINYNESDSILQRVEVCIYDYLKTLDIFINKLDLISDEFNENSISKCLHRTDTKDPHNFPTFVWKNVSDVITKKEDLRVKYNTFKQKNKLSDDPRDYISKIKELLISHLILTWDGQHERHQKLIEKTLDVVNKITNNSFKKRHFIPNQEITIHNPYGCDGDTYNKIYYPYPVKGCTGYGVSDNGVNICMNANKCGSCYKCPC